MDVKKQLCSHSHTAPMASEKTEKNHKKTPINLKQGPPEYEERELHNSSCCLVTYLLK